MQTILLDTNIYISGILFGGKPRDVMGLARSGKFDVIVSEHILWEIRKVLSQKFKVPGERLNIIEHDILNLSRLIKPTSRIDAIAGNNADNLILACAVDGEAGAIITGDNDLLQLKEFNNIQILTPSRFLNKLE